MESTQTPLRKARIQKKLSQAVLAERIGVSQAVLSAFESMTKKPSADTAARLAAELGISELELLYPERFMKKAD